MDTFIGKLLVRVILDEGEKRTWGDRRVTGMQNFGERQVDPQVQPGPTAPQTGDEGSQEASQTSRQGH